MCAKKIGVIIFVIALLGFLFIFSDSRKPSYDQNLKPSIVSFMPDFYEFWSEDRDEPVEKKMALWDALFEIKHEEFYLSVIYQRSSRETLE